MNELAQYLNYYMRYFDQWAGLPDGTLESIAQIESSFNPTTGSFNNVCNSVQACGLMQLKPIALADIKRVYKINIDPMNPVLSIVGAACLFNINRMYLRSAGIYNPDVWTMIVAYNGGWTQGRNYAMRRGIGKEQANYLTKAYLTMVA